MVKIDPKQFTAKTIEDAIELALRDFGVTKDEIGYEVIQEPSRGFLGLKNKPAIIEVFQNEAHLVTLLNEYLRGLLSYFDGKFETSVKMAGKTLVVSLDGEGLGKLIGKYGRTLGALQHLMMIFINRVTDTKIDVKLDIGEYRKNRRKKVEEIAELTAKKVIKERKNVELAPMFSFERKIVHEYIRKYYPELNTKSVGLEPYRKIVVGYEIEREYAEV